MPEIDTSLDGFYVRDCQNCDSSAIACSYDYLRVKWLIQCLACDFDSGWQATKQESVDSWNDPPGF